ncbi:hypothetical protein [Roseovarius sp. CH_XMU1461]|uniref:hypothetical protein n=1 Tax=Roseovarius sp. CH_XMU1461 TaxID=3107777 RepID=UPI00300A90D3
MISAFLPETPPRVFLRQRAGLVRLWAMKLMARQGAQPMVKKRSQECLQLMELGTNKQQSGKEAVTSDGYSAQVK